MKGIYNNQTAHKATVKDRRRTLSIIDPLQKEKGIL